MKKVIGCAVLGAMVILLAGAVPSAAGGSRVYFGVNVGVGPGYWGHGYWGPRHWRPLYWGPGVWWGNPVWWWGLPYPYYYPAPPVIVQQPPTYVQPAPQPEEQQYWYYCQNPQGYYPYVKQCPNGWMKVVPRAAPPGQ